MVISNSFCFHPTWGNDPLIKPYFLGVGGIGGVPLGSHDSVATEFSLSRVGTLEF